MKAGFIKPDIPRTRNCTGNVLHQNYVQAFGRIEGDIFYRTGGYGEQLGIGAPMCKVLTARPAKKLGRPRGKKPQQFRAYLKRPAPAVTVLYAMDWQGHLWSMRQDAQGLVRARTLDCIPYAALRTGRRQMLRDIQSRVIAELAAAQATWQANQDAAHIEQLRQRCPLV